MTPHRITPAAAPFTEPVDALLASITPPGKEPLKLFRVLARNPRVLQRMFAGNLLDRGALSLREREIVILRTCALCGSDYEWGVHAALFAKAAGFDESEVAATAGDEGNWEHRERLLIRLADELHETSRVTDGLWEELAACYREEQIVELVAVAGYYHMVSFFTNALGVECESWAQRLPASGTADRQR